MAGYGGSAQGEQNAIFVHGLDRAAETAPASSQPPRLDEQAPWVVGYLPIGPEDVGCVPDVAKRLVHVGMVTATTREPRPMWPVDPSTGACESAKKTGHLFFPC
jgi:hypothetical protein